MLRRAAVSAKAAASGTGHSELSIAISEEKNVYEVGMKLIAAKTDASVYSYKWACGETNKAISDVFLKICGLNSVWAEAQMEFANKYKEYRATLKEILHEEKNMDESRKQQNTCSSRLTKLKKQVDIARQKNDTSKLEALVPDLQQAIIANDKAYEEYEQKMDRIEAFKATRIRQSLVLLSEAYLTLAHKMTTIFTAQKQIAELITAETVPNSNMPTDPLVYEASAKKSYQVLEVACKSLTFPVPDLPGDPRTSLRTFICQDSPQPPNSAPSSAVSQKVPIPLPQKMRGATSLDKGLSGSTEDIHSQLSPGVEFVEPVFPRVPLPLPQKARGASNFDSIRSGSTEDFACRLLPGQEVNTAATCMDELRTVVLKKSKSGSHFPMKETGESDEYSQVQDMYDWVWQRQSEILSGDSGDYMQPFDFVRGKNTDVSTKLSKVIHRRNTTGNVLEEDSSGYLVPLEVVDTEKTHSIPEDNRGMQVSNQDKDEFTNGTCATIDSGEYAYARVMTTSTVRPAQKTTPRPQSPKPYTPKAQSPKPQSPKPSRRPEPLPKPKSVEKFS